MITICFVRAKQENTGIMRIPRGTRIERCPPLQTNVRWPAPVDQRLNELVDRMSDETAVEASRSRLLAALVSCAPSDPRRLDRLIQRYRGKAAGEVVLQPSGPIVVRPRQPGRPPR
jgi:hypothetical protein